MDQRSVFVSEYKGPLNVKIKSYKQNVLLMICKSLNITVECNFCSSLHNLNTDVCGNCCKRLFIEYNYSNNEEFVGNLKLTNCKLISLNTGFFVFTCLECDTKYEEEIDKKRNTPCINCFRPIVIQIESIEYISEPVKKVLG
jgi:hypothetical protein